jgi:hypothetical protein
MSNQLATSQLAVFLPRTKSASTKQARRLKSVQFPRDLKKENSTFNFTTTPGRKENAWLARE